MTFNDALKLSMAQFPTLYSDRAAVLNQFFVVNGNGMDFSETGELESRHERSSNELVAIERYVAAGKHKQPLECVEYVPAELAEHLFTFHRIPADIEERLAKAEFRHWYPMSEGYNGLEKLPDNIPADWLNAAYECATLIVNTPQDLDLEITAQRNAYQFLDCPIFDEKGYKVIGREKNTREQAEAKALMYLIAERKRIYDIAAKALVTMKAQFPNHKFEFNPPPTWDANRPFDKNDITPWPMEGEGERWEGVASWDTIMGSFRKAIKFAYNMRRKNEGKDIPYTGYPIGYGDRAGCLGPEERFKAESLRYDKEDQGRDALEVIMGSMALKEVRERTNDYFRHQKVEAEHAAYMAKQRELAKTDPKVAARLRIQDRIDAGIKPAFDQTDPLEVEAANEMNAARARMALDIKKMLGDATEGDEPEEIEQIQVVNE
jgi:hypothetical protein